MDRYIAWKRVPEGLKTMTQWAKSGFALRRGAYPQALFKGQHGTYPLYAESQVIPKPVKPKRPAPQSLALNIENIAQCMHIVSKAAKRRRDSAQRFYSQRRHGRAARAADEKLELYSIKDNVLNKLIASGFASFVAYHSQTIARTVKEVAFVEEECDEDGYEEEIDDEYPHPRRRKVIIRKDITVTTYLACYAVVGYRFHLPLGDKPAGAEIVDLGSWISSAAPRDKKIPLSVAKQTLALFLKGNCESLRQGLQAIEPGDPPFG